ncbi:hypothetical protein HEB94_001633 [Actinopolymorpha pittospori]|uniref:Uncharacterized protein n=1 Tax=Actinopolymorpha pittospori TaxID=648752 RepID=A0A927RA90_9ACTN|nr:hypothetical protein [Actinopolymorpha pittospori]
MTTSGPKHPHGSTPAWRRAGPRDAVLPQKPWCEGGGCPPGLRTRAADLPRARAYHLHVPRLKPNFVAYTPCRTWSEPPHSLERTSTHVLSATNGTACTFDTRESASSIGRNWTVTRPSENALPTTSRKKDIPGV